MALYSLEILERACGDNKPFMNHMLQIFIRENTKAIENIKQAYKENNIVEVKSIAHRIKPSVNHLKMTTTLDNLRSIEQFEGSDPDLTHLIDSTCNSIAEVIEDLKRITGTE